MAETALDKIGSFLEDFTGDQVRTEFMMYEPWDVEKRPDWLFREAEKKHVDLRNDDFVALYGADPHEFQTGYIMDYKSFIAAIFGGNQIGKSYAAMMDLIIMMTAEVPYSLRYDKGYDTGIIREINKSNILRFGRRDSATGEIIDYDPEQKEDSTWNCGTIKGVGKYPTPKLAPPGQKAWLGTFSQAREEYWWPRLKQHIPTHCLDTNRGNMGFSEKKSIVYLTSGREIHVITYEQGYAKFEAENVWMILLDEEPPDQRIFTSAVQHISQGGIGVRLIETPYRGLTWTFDLILKQSLTSKDTTIYHATQFDSPYQDRKGVLKKMKLMKPWEVEARAFGVHSEQKGRPYFDRERINRWLRSHRPTHSLFNITAADPWDNAMDACTCAIYAEKIFEEEERGEWQIWEDVDPYTPYWMSVDTGLGATDAEDAADRNAAHIMRPPREEKDENMAEPVIVASCRSSDTTINFARTCLYAAIHYNFCLMAPESKGETAATFIAEIRDYPFMFTMTVISNKTNKPTEKIGFDTNSRTRRLIFDLIGDFLNEYDDKHYPNIPHYYTLKELAELVVAKRGRPDHPNGGTSDCAVAFGIGLYVWVHAKDQIRNNRGYYTKKSSEDYVDKWGTRINNTSEKRPVLGSKRGLDRRSKR